jgi:outer membrane receptor protein involved in Fe transport
MDSLWNYELGGEMALDERKLLLRGSILKMDWSSIQQSIYLNCTFNTIINVGAARSRGAELERAGHVIDPLELRLGYNDAKVTRSFAGSPLPAGSRILEVPALTATVSARYEIPIDDSRRAFVTSDYRCTGDSLSENTSLCYPLARPSYSMINARVGITWEKPELSLFGNNLTNQKANLGDLSFWTARQSITPPNGHRSRPARSRFAPRRNWYPISECNLRAGRNYRGRNSRWIQLPARSKFGAAASGHRWSGYNSRRMLRTSRSGAGGGDPLGYRLRSRLDCGGVVALTMSQLA